MPHTAYKTILDSIKTPNDAVGIFPTNTYDLDRLVIDVKALTLERIAAIKAIPANERTFDNSIRAQDTLDADIQKVMALLTAIAMLYTQAELRDTAERLMIEFNNFVVDTLSFNKDLYNAFIAYTQHAGKTEQLTQEEQFFIEESLKSFKRAGYELPDDKQEELKKLEKELAELSLAFENNIAKDIRSITVTADDLAGLTDEQRVQFFDAQTGNYILKTDYPTIDLVLQNCAVESTRKALWKEFQNRAHPQNDAILKRVIILRDIMAKLLGYASYADLNLDDSMAESVPHVKKFLNEVEHRSVGKAQQELKELTRNLPAEITLTPDGKIKPWDMRYLMNHYKKEHAQIDERAIAEYFPLEKTVAVLLELYEEFLGIQFEQIPLQSLPHAQRIWHPDVKLVKAALGDQLLGYLFLDLHPRDHKYTHACHLTCIAGLRDKNGKQTVPDISIVIANFPKSTGEKPALLLRNDVNIFFHEFGHAVHALCGATQMNGFFGTHTKRDFVELPSQMLEEWLWQPQVLKRISSHYKTGEPLQDVLIDAIIKTKNIDTGTSTKRQLSLAYLALACFDDKIDTDMKREYQKLYEQLMPYQLYSPEENFISSFGHLMGYGAQYYGYLWSKVFALDLFEYIKEQGMSPEIGARYRDLVIGKGGSRKPMDLLREFLGREPKSDAFFDDMIT